MITLPVIYLLQGSASGKDLSGGVDFVNEVLAHPRLRDGFQVRRVRTAGTEPVPIMQPQEFVSAGVGRLVIGTCYVSVEGHRHVEHRHRHWTASPARFS
ncbi:MAG TPA: hypothetical protein VMV09_03465 [Candidatus Saccharimonadales bacterium]|nr:hypothetical protein [Candidatus Saccharimonadales bacterium]